MLQIECGSETNRKIQYCTTVFLTCKVNTLPLAVISAEVSIIVVEQYGFFSGRHQYFESRYNADVMLLSFFAFHNNNKWKANFLNLI